MFNITNNLNTLRVVNYKLLMIFTILYISPDLILTTFTMFYIYITPEIFFTILLLVIINDDNFTIYKPEVFKPVHIFTYSPRGNVLYSGYIRYENYTCPILDLMEQLFDIFNSVMGVTNGATFTKTYNSPGVVIVEGNGFSKRPTYKLITPIPPKTTSKQLFGVLDIETTNINNKLYPYAIGFAFIKDGKICEEYFYINLTGKGSLESRSSDILKQVCEFIELNFKDYTIYTHNLGKFDGYFLLKPFLKHFGPYKLLIDKYKAIISLTLPGNILFKDSLRILPLSLEKLGNLFETEHRKLEFDHTTATVSEIRKASFRAKLIPYLRNDCLCLIEVLILASKFILEKFEVDIHDSYSISSLAFIIFRTKYLSIPIPTLPIWLDRIIRASYRGGSVDVYKVTGNKAHYFDVNSLYPHGMCNEIPFNYLGFKFKPNLDTFFGFAYAYITVPKGTEVPLVPIKSDSGSLYYPTGHISGLFFSKELEMFIKQGYKVVTIYGYEFSNADIFTNYVMDLYAIKASTDGSMQKLVKLLLNGLYGYFGRDPNTQTAAFINTAQCQELGRTNTLIDITPISEDLYLILAETMPDKSVCARNGKSYTDTLRKVSSHLNLKSNVAISSAITSYSRIIMAFFKTIPGNVLIYSDTDSVFLLIPLDPKYISPDKLGMMKDVLKGEVINDFLFLEPKLYYYKTPTEVVIKARGVKEGYITTELIHRLHQGETINFEFKRLYKSFTNLTVNEKTINYSMKLNIDRKIPVYDSNGVLIAYKPTHLPFTKLFTKSNS